MTKAIVEEGQHLKTGDTEPALVVQLLKDNGMPKDLSSVDTVSVSIAQVNESPFIDDDTDGNVTIDEAENGRVSYQWQSTDTETAATLVGEFVVTESTEQSTYPNSGFFEVYVQEGLQ